VSFFGWNGCEIRRFRRRNGRFYLPATPYDQEGTAEEGEETGRWLRNNIEGEVKSRKARGITRVQIRRQSYRSGNIQRKRVGLITRKRSAGGIEGCSPVSICNRDNLSESSSRSIDVKGDQLNTTQNDIRCTAEINSHRVGCSKRPKNGGLRLLQYLRLIYFTDILT
jgi:hypothetical protein